MWVFVKKLFVKNKKPRSLDEVKMTVKDDGKGIDRSPLYLHPYVDRALIK